MLLHYVYSLVLQEKGKEVDPSHSFHNALGPKIDTREKKGEGEKKKHRRNTFYPPRKGKKRKGADLKMIASLQARDAEGKGGTKKRKIETHAGKPQLV